MALLQFPKSQYPTTSKTSVSTLSPSHTLYNLRTRDNYPVTSRQLEKVTSKTINTYSQIIAAALAGISEDIADQEYTEFDKNPISKILNFNDYKFQLYGLNPLKNILVDPEITENIKMISEDTFMAYRPSDPKQLENNDFYQALTGILVNFDILENYAIFVAFQDETYGIFKLEYSDMSAFFKSNEDDICNITLKVQIEKKEPSIFAMYDSLYSPTGYGLIVEIDKNMWQIIK